MRHALVSLALTALVAAPAGAQQLKMTFSDGRVSVDATSVPVRSILAEWAKLGETKVVGGDRVSGAPMTLKLVDVPEAQALDIILRNTAGYMTAPRIGGNGASRFDRILVLATSATPPPSAVRPTSPSPRPTAGTQRFIPPRFVNQGQANPDEDEPEPAEEDPGVNQPVFQFPQPGTFPPGTTVTINPNTGAPQAITVAPSEPTTTGGAPGGFGVVGSPVPGVVQQPPQQQQQPLQGQPGPMTRPPGQQ